MARHRKGEGDRAMMEFLYTLDVAIFHFINGTLANPVSDLVMPFLTDLNVHWPGRIILGGAWLLLLVKGGKRGRAAALLLIPLIALTDQASSALVKRWLMRPRPCHMVGGAPLVDHIRLLVDCGGGYSFPSSHAVNNFAAATFLSWNFPRWRGYLFGWASLIALSRVIVGVHYPSDIVGGMAIGIAAAWIFIFMWGFVVRRNPALAAYTPPGKERGAGTAGGG
jgi:undecaprenyl-diphosphatase